MRLTSPRLHLPTKLRDELIRYAVVSAYLYVCFGALILYKAAILRAHNIDFPIFGLAIMKALILGKFILAGQALRLGERYREKQLIYRVAYKVIVFAALLFALSIIEEIIVAKIHGHSVAEALANVAGGTWPEILASCVLLCLILVPYFVLSAIDTALGEKRLYHMFFGGG
jgi:hypothetical protein